MNYREAEGFYGARGIRGPIYSRRKLERETVPFIYYEIIYPRREEDQLAFLAESNRKI